jgi:hypothetical protein
MKTTAPGHNKQSDHIERFKDLLRRKCLMERLVPVLGELLRMILECNGSFSRKRLLPHYCYKILWALQKKHFKVLPVANSLGTGVGQINWEALGRIIGAGLRCLRFDELESDKIVQAEISPDAETEFAGLICSSSWLREQEAAINGHVADAIQKYFDVQCLRSLATACQQSAYQSGAGPMAQMSGGVQKGIEGFLDESGQLVSEHARDNIYWFLLIVWPEIQEMQQSGQKTRKDFCDWIQPFASAGLRLQPAVYGVYLCILCQGTRRTTFHRRRECDGRSGGDV